MEGPLALGSLITRGGGFGGRAKSGMRPYKVILQDNCRRNTTDLGRCLILAVSAEQHEATDNVDRISNYTESHGLSVPFGCLPR